MLRWFGPKTSDRDVGDVVVGTDEQYSVDTRCGTECEGITVDVRPEAWTSQTCTAVWFEGGHDSPPRHAHVSVRLRGPRGPHRVGDVPPTPRSRRTTADGTARLPQVGRPPMVGVTTLSPSQRGAHEPASCLRGLGIAETPQREETPAFTPGRMSYLPRVWGDSRRGWGTAIDGSRSHPADR